MILAAHIIGKVLGGVIGKVLLDRKAWSTRPRAQTRTSTRVSISFR